MVDASHVTPRMTPDESQQIAQLVHSSGWRLVMEHLLMPRLASLTRQLDNPHCPELSTQLYRGQKLMLIELTNDLYRLAGLPNPFVQHQQAFLTTLRVHAPLEVPTGTPLVHKYQRGIILCKGVYQEVESHSDSDRDVTCPDCLVILEEEHARLSRRRSVPTL